MIRLVVRYTQYADSAIARSHDTPDILVCGAGVYWSARVRPVQLFTLPGVKVERRTAEQYLVLTLFSCWHYTWL